MRAIMACSIALFAAGCGSGGLSTGGGSDLAVAPDLARAPDLATPPDMASPPPVADLAVPSDLSQTPPYDAAGVACGMQTCGGKQKCCVMLKGMMAMPMCMDSCPDGDFTVACDGPEDCKGNPCCVSINNAMIDGAGAQCTMQPDSCPPKVDIQSRSGMDRLCHIDADCTAGAPNTQLPSCCTLMQNGNAAHVCLSKIFAQFLGATCP